mmetsp:Transcript_13534/g.29423  ORF Transcript_13534/g.29423 Transcript_13534/m.29423 type:complete len:88 (-) Transcript_13534:819-1082(-)
MFTYTNSITSITETNISHERYFRIPPKYSVQENATPFLNSKHTCDTSEPSPPPFDIFLSLIELGIFLQSVHLHFLHQVVTLIWSLDC